MLRDILFGDWEYATFACVGTQSYRTTSSSACRRGKHGAIGPDCRSGMGQGRSWLSVLLLSIAVQVLSWGLGSFHHLEWVSSNPEVDRLAKLFVFIGVAWWLGGSSRNTLLVWGLAVLGYLVASFAAGGLEEWRKGLEGMRTGFGIRNKQHGSMLFGVALLGLAVFARRIMMTGTCWVFLALHWVGDRAGDLCGRHHYRADTGDMAGPGYFSSRGSVDRTSMGEHAKHGALHAAARCRWCHRGAVAHNTGGVLFGGTLSERMEAEPGVVAELLQGDLDAVPYSSVGIRIHTWVAASEWIAERPLVGWGDEGRGLVIDHTLWLPDFVKANFGHLHNFFLEVWVVYGLLGLDVIAALAVWGGRGTWLAWRGGVMPGDMALFGAAFFSFTG